MLDYTVLINQTAIHSLPAVLNQVNSALLRAVTGDPDSSISLTRHPLPTLPLERTVQVSQESGMPHTRCQNCLINLAFELTVQTGLAGFGFWCMLESQLQQVTDKQLGSSWYLIIREIGT